MRTPCFPAPAILLCAIGTGTLGGAPALGAQRTSICLNGEWQFQTAGPDLSFPPSGQWDETPIRIPSPWNANSFSRGDGGDFHCFPTYPADWESVKYAWHRRTFDVPAEWQGSRVFLRFEAVHYWADVYVNGRKAGSHEGGFTPFEVDVTEAVSFGGSNELVVGIRDASHYNVQGRCPYGWGSFWGGHIRGIWQDVHLIARPAVHISDVFIRTSVEKALLEADVTVVNTTRDELDLELAATVADWQPSGARSGDPVLRLPPGRLHVPAGGQATALLRQQWPQPRLWWPDDPHLYVLSCTVLGPDEPLDSLDTRFGFRELTLPPEGGKFRLNGVTWTGRGDAWHFMGIPQMTPDFARAWYAMARQAHVNIIRLHAQVYPSYYLDVADEMGMLIVDETSLWGSALNFYYNDDFLRRGRQHVQELVLRDRNHPSVVIWSVGNEIGYDPPGVNNAPNRDWVYARYADLAGEMRRLDPTRPVSCDGDGSLNGRLDIYSLHYPGPGRPSAEARFFTIGESGSMFYSTPSQVAYRIGERAYRSSLDRLDAVGLEMADHIEGYRKWAAYATPFNLQWYGLQPLPLNLTLAYDRLDTPGVKPERIGPYSTTLNAGRDSSLPEYEPNPVFTHVKRAFVPVRFFVDQRGRSLYGGRTTRRTLSVHNDVLSDSRLRLEWTLELDGRKVVSNEATLAMKAGEHRQVAVDLPLPAVAKMTPALWRLRLAEGDVAAFDETRTLFVYPARTSGIELTRPGAVYDPAGRAEGLSELTGLPRVAEVGEASAGSLLVVGPGARLSAEVSEQLLQAVRGGLRLLVLEDNSWPADPTASWALGGGAYGLAFAKVPSHPLLAGLQQSQLEYWGSDGQVGSRCFEGVPPCDLVPVITCRDGGIAAAEVVVGRGRALVFALPLAAKAGEEPAARVLLGNALSYLALAEEPRERPAAVLAQVGRYPGTALRSLGLSPEGATAGQVQVLVADGGRPMAAPDLQRAKELLAAGGDLLVLRGQPGAEDWLRQLTGVDVGFSPCDRAELAKAQPTHPLLRGFDLADLYWIEDQTALNILPWAVDAGSAAAERLLVTSRTDWRRWVQRGENTKTASVLRSELEDKPECCGLLVVPAGKGRVICWQPPVSLAHDKSLRLLGQLLTNLGAPWRRRALSEEELSILNLDEDGYLCAWLSLGPVDGAPDELFDGDPLGGEETVRPMTGAMAAGACWIPRRTGREWNISDKRWFGDRPNSCMYAAAYVHSPEQRKCRLLVGSDDYVKVWLNGELTHSNRAVRPLTLDQDTVGPVQLTQGWNLLLVKVVNVGGHWGLALRIAGADGRPLEDLSVRLEDPVSGLVELSRQGWRARSEPAGGVEAAFDGDPRTRWSSNRPMDDTMWFELDLGRVESIARVELDSSRSPGDYPRGFTIQVSQDGREWLTVAESRQGEGCQVGGRTIVSLSPTPARWLRIRQTGPEGCSGGLWWSIHELRVYTRR